LRAAHLTFSSAQLSELQFLAPRLDMLAPQWHWQWQQLLSPSRGKKSTQSKAHKRSAKPTLRSMLDQKTHASSAGDVEHSEAGALYDSVRAVLAYTGVVSSMHALACDRADSPVRARAAWKALGLQRPKGTRGFVKLQLLAETLRKVSAAEVLRVLPGGQTDVRAVLECCHAVLRHSAVALLLKPHRGAAQALAGDARLSTALTALARLHELHSNNEELMLVPSLAAFAVQGGAGILAQQAWLREELAEGKQETGFDWSEEALLLLLRADEEQPSTSDRAAIARGELRAFLHMLLRRCPTTLPLRVRIQLFHHKNMPLLKNNDAKNIDVFMIRRSELVQSSVDAFFSRKRVDLKKKWKVQFENEPGIDLNGVRR
jgi:hypothetical protein